MDSRHLCLSLLAPLLGLACAPKISATIVVDEATPAVARPELEPVTSKPEVGDFDVTAALDGCEQLLLTVDQFVDEPNGGDYDQMHSWLDEEGLRSLYYYARQATETSLLGYVASLFGTAIYSEGPHGQELDYYAADFGHYSPVFVARVGEVAAALAQDSARVERTRPAFERHLRRQALTYLLVHGAVHHDPTWFEGFVATYSEQLGDEDVNFSYYDQLEPVNRAFDSQGMSWYEADTAAYFWVRRELDGTAMAWRDALVTLLRAYGEATELPPPALPRSAQP